jgi:hypothetical protein
MFSFSGSNCESSENKVVDLPDPVGQTAKIIQLVLVRCFLIFVELYGKIPNSFRAGGFSSFFSILITHFSQ